MKRNVFLIAMMAVMLAGASQASAAIVAGYSNVAFSNAFGWSAPTTTTYSDNTNRTALSVGLTNPTKLTLTGTTFSVASTDSNFAIATLTYYNGTNLFSINSVDTAVTLTITDPTTASGTFAYTFSFKTTFDWLGLDKLPDTLYLTPEITDPITFAYNGYTYTISLLGFYLNGISVESVTVAEKASATMTLYATVTAVPDPEDPPVVPEPATCLIWSVFGGIGAIGCWRRKRAA